MKTLSLRWSVLALTLLAGGPAVARAEADDDIRHTLAAQQTAWNRGDLDGFMSGYARTDDLRFASGGSVTYGWLPTLDRYRARYPDPTAMGTLTFSDLIVTTFSPDAAIVFGNWELARGGDKAWGLFTLTMKRTIAGWRIFQDHTSLAEPGK